MDKWYKQRRFKSVAGKDKKKKLRNKKVVTIDTVAEVLGMDESTIEEKCNAIRRIQEIESATILDLQRKSRCRWILEGEKNSVNFHGLVNSNIKRNRITSLNINGIWTSDPVAVKNECFEFFKKQNIGSPLSLDLPCEVTNLGAS
ncbi:hypothetical protein LXL04_038539 [Taraxacum kok-saghyz]